MPPHPPTASCRLAQIEQLLHDGLGSTVLSFGEGDGVGNAAISLSYSNDDLVELIVRQLDTAAELGTHHSFAPIIAAVGGLRQSVLNDWATRLSIDQRDRLHAGLRAAHSLVAAQVSPQMGFPLGRMFGGVHFLVNTWAAKRRGKIAVQGTFLQASALAKSLEAYLEYSRLWVCVFQMDDEIAAGRVKVFSELLDVKGLAADCEEAD